MDFGLRGKTALVTGGSRGLGRHSALALAEEGCNVAICARGRESLDRTAGDLRSLGIEALGVQADVTTEEGTSRVFQETLNALGPIDVLVNNAGDAVGDDFDAADDAAWAFTFELNLFAGIRLIRLSLPHMKTQKWGRIINVSSIWGREYGPALTYVTAKAALIAFSKTLAVELADSGVTVNTVAPGSIELPGGIWEDFRRSNPREVVEDFIAQNLPMGRFGWPEPIGALVAYLASSRADLITGACINIDGGQSRSLI